MELINIADYGNDSARFSLFLQDLRERLGLAHASYGCSNTFSDDIRGATTYPDAWQRHYVERGLHAVDPTLSAASRSVMPVDWSRLPQVGDAARVFREAQDFGIPAQGITVPVRGPYGDYGFLSVASDESPGSWPSLCRKIIGDLHMAAVHIHDAMLGSEPLYATLHSPRLSHREIEILQWIAMGKSQAGIATILNISPRTVEVHLRSARTKLGALSTSQAVGRGIALRLTEPG